MMNWIVSAISTVVNLGLVFFLVKYVHMSMTEALLFVVVTLLCGIPTSVENEKKGGQMRERQKKAGAGVRELARSLDRSPSHICRVLRGERKASAELMRRRAELRARGIKVRRAPREGK